MLKSWQKVRAQLQMPGLFFIVCVLAFGLQIPWLGFYLDDWIILNAYNLGGGERLFEYAFLDNRPLVFWIWWLGFELFGSTPIYWHVWALLWRWLTVVIFWMGWRLLWPKAPRQVAFAALLFAVYPVFKQQPTALAYSFQWISFFLYGLSIFWMILSIRRPKSFYLLMFGAILADFIQLFSQEYYVGIELFRPVVIWLALAGSVSPWKDRLKRTMFYWAPYMILLGLYVLWRLVFMPTPGPDRNAPTLLYGLLTTPVQSMVELGTMFVQSVVEMLIGVWYQTMEPGLFVPTPPANLVAWGLMLVTSMLLLAFFLSRPPRLQAQAGGSGELAMAAEEQPWYSTAIPAGFLAMIFGFAPGLAMGRHIYDLTGIYNDRFGLAAMFGASLLVVGLVEVLLRKESYRVVLICLLIGLAVGQSFRTTSNYRWSWEKQLRLYWQLKWRAPELRVPTTLLGDGSLVSYIGTWANTSAFLQMYAPEKDVHFMDYWYLDVSKVDLVPHAEEQAPFEDWKKFMRYTAPARNSLALSYKPDAQQCLWILTEYDETNPYLTQDEISAMRLTNLEQILPESSRTLRSDIFGAEIPYDWCYYYQKGDLARQLDDWPDVLRLWKEAGQKDLLPQVGVEYSPFIEAFAQTGDFDQALELTEKAALTDYQMRDYLCATWRRIGNTTESDARQQEALDRAAEDLPCDRSTFP